MTNAKSREEFERELAEIRKMLGNGNVGRNGNDHGLEAGISGDFELPYSTLPKLRGEPWSEAEPFTRQAPLVGYIKGMNEPRKCPGAP